MAVSEIAGGTIGELNFAANAAVGFINPLGAQVDAFLGLTLGPVQAQISAELSANLGASGSISISIGDPLLQLRLALQAIGRIQAAIQAALVLPPINVSASAQLSTTLAAAAAAEAKLGLLDAAIKALLQLKIPAAELAAAAAAELSAGPVILLEMSSDTLANQGNNVESLFSSGLSLAGGIAPGDTCFGYILVTKSPTAKAALDFILRGI